MSILDGCRLMLKKGAIPRAAVTFNSPEPPEPQEGSGSSRASRRVVRNILSSSAKGNLKKPES